jgi:hypothetical protein
MLSRRRFFLSLLCTPLVVRPAAAQSDFGGGRPEERYFSVEAGVGNGRHGPLVEGYVHNRYDFHAERVRLALTLTDASGGQLPPVTAYVGDVPPRGRAFFQTPVPPGAAKVTASVSYFEWTPRGGGGGSM